MGVRARVFLFSGIMLIGASPTYAQNGVQLGQSVEAACQPAEGQMDPRSALHSLFKTYASMAKSTIVDAQSAGAATDQYSNNSKQDSVNAIGNVQDTKGVSSMYAGAGQSTLGKNTAESAMRALKQDGAQMAALLERAPAAFETDKKYMCFADYPGTNEMPPNGQNNCDICPSNDSSAKPSPDDGRTQCGQCKVVGQANRETRAGCVQIKKQEMDLFQQKVKECGTAASQGQQFFAKTASELEESAKTQANAAESLKHYSDQDQKQGELPKGLQAQQAKYDYGNGKSGTEPPNATNTQKSSADMLKGGVEQKVSADTKQQLQAGAQQSNQTLNGRAEQEAPEAAWKPDPNAKVLQGHVEQKEYRTEASVERQKNALAAAQIGTAPSNPSPNPAPTETPPNTGGYDNKSVKYYGGADFDFAAPGIPGLPTLPSVHVGANAGVQFTKIKGDDGKDYNAVGFTGSWSYGVDKDFVPDSDVVHTANLFKNAKGVKVGPSVHGGVEISPNEINKPGNRVYQTPIGPIIEDQTDSVVGSSPIGSYVQGGDGSHAIEVGPGVKAGIGAEHETSYFKEIFRVPALEYPKRSIY